jgi:hypothetical protein
MSWVKEMRKGLDRMWDGMIKDKIRQDGFLSDMAPKWWSVLIWIFIGLIMFGTSLNGQQLATPELVPYQIVPIDLQPGDCNLEVGIRLVNPYHIQLLPTPQQQETLEIIYQRIGYEIVNPHMSAGLFQIDDRLYHLIRIPYTGATEDYGYDWD